MYKRVKEGKQMIYVDPSEKYELKLGIDRDLVQKLGENIAKRPLDRDQAFNFLAAEAVDEYKGLGEDEFGKGLEPVIMSRPVVAIDRRTGEIYKILEPGTISQYPELADLAHHPSSWIIFDSPGYQEGRPELGDQNSSYRIPKTGKGFEEARNELWARKAKAMMTKSGESSVEEEGNVDPNVAEQS